MGTKFNHDRQGQRLHCKTDTRIAGVYNLDPTALTNKRHVLVNLSIIYLR